MEFISQCSFVHKICYYTEYLMSQIIACSLCKPYGQNYVCKLNVKLNLWLRNAVAPSETYNNLNTI
jgi:hypothetical protein